MFKRIINLPKSKSYFLFGARGTGKSTLLKKLYSAKESYRLDLLLPAVEARYARDPESLLAEIRSLPKAITTIVLDEVQKVPKLLDVVHYALENETRKFRFVLTGSSGRKLKRSSANLLAGRAFVRELFPLVVDEIGAAFDLQDALSWGSLPYIFSMEDADEKRDFLLSYVHTYISEEIQREQLVRNLDPFRRFLEVAAQLNGNMINYSNIAKGIGVDPKTVESYYSILEDTLLGHFILPFAFSFRKRLRKSPKFYFFDTGVCRSIARSLSSEPVQGTSYYGEVFEQFICSQIVHLAKYKCPEAKISYYRDENDIEVDLVIEIPGKQPLFLEIKSAAEVTESMTKNLKTVRKDFPESSFMLWSQNKIPKSYDGINALFWKNGLNELFA